MFLMVAVALPGIYAAMADQSLPTSNPRLGMVSNAVEYVLGVDSSYSEGCMGEGDGPIQCLCPIWLASEFGGGFDLALLSNEEPGKTVYQVSNVDWVIGFGEDLIVITGGGQFSVTDTGKGNVQRLILTLKFDDGNHTDEIEFDSGTVAGGETGEAPPIDISVSMAGFQACYDISITIKAQPLPPLSAVAR
jgi:hypothetical protein